MSRVKLSNPTHARTCEHCESSFAHGTGPERVPAAGAAPASGAEASDAFSACDSSPRQLHPTNTVFPLCTLVEEIRRRRSSSSPCRAWSARAAGRTMPPGASRRGRASLHLSLRCESSPWRPAGDESGGSFRFPAFRKRQGNGMEAEAEASVDSPSAFFFYCGGKMERWRSLWGFNFIERCWPTCQLHIRRKLSLSLEGIPDTGWILCSCF